MYKPASPYFLQYADGFLNMACEQCFNDNSKTFVELKTLKTSSGDDTFYTGYLDSAK